MAHSESNDEGYLAGEAGIPSSMNPYQHGTEDYHQWLAGWSAAQDDYNRELTRLDVTGDVAVIVVLFIIFIPAVLLVANIYGVL